MNITYTRFWGAHADPSLSHADMARGVAKLLAPMTPSVYGPDVLGYYNFVVTPARLRDKTPVEYAHLGYSSETEYKAVRERPDHNSQNYGPWHFSFTNLPEGHELKDWEGCKFFLKTQTDIPFKDQSTSFEAETFTGEAKAGKYYELGDTRGDALIGASYLARIITRQDGVSEAAFLESVENYLSQENALQGAKAKVIRLVEDSFIEYIYADTDDELKSFLGTNPIQAGDLQFSQIAQAVSAQDIMDGNFTVDPENGGAFRLVWPE